MLGNPPIIPAATADLINRSATGILTIFNEQGLGRTWIGVSVRIEGGRVLVSHVPAGHEICPRLAAGSWVSWFFHDENWIQRVFVEGRASVVPAGEVTLGSGHPGADRLAVMTRIERIFTFGPTGARRALTSPRRGGMTSAVGPVFECEPTLAC
jgi:hypothetical protein